MTCLVSHMKKDGVFSTDPGRQMSTFQKLLPNWCYLALSEERRKDFKEHSSSKTIFVSVLYLPTMTCEILKERISSTVVLLIGQSLGLRNTSVHLTWTDESQRRMQLVLVLILPECCSPLPQHLSTCFQLFWLSEFPQRCLVRMLVQSI